MTTEYQPRFAWKPYLMSVAFCSLGIVPAIYMAHQMVKKNSQAPASVLEQKIQDLPKPTPWNEYQPQGRPVEGLNGTPTRKK